MKIKSLIFKDHMFNMQRIQEISKNSDIIPFLQQAVELKQAGVLFYEIHIENLTKRYVGTEKSLEEPITMSKTPIADFNEQRIKEALQRRREKKTTYIQFLQELAQAGIQKYLVDLVKNTVSYYGKNSQAYVESIPLPAQ